MWIVGQCKKLVKPVPTLQFVLISSFISAYWAASRFRISKWIGLCWKILGYMIWTLAEWSNEGCIVCVSRLFSVLHNCWQLPQLWHMSLAFNQKQQCSPDQSVHTRASVLLQWRHYLREHTGLQTFDWIMTQKTHFSGASMHLQFKTHLIIASVSSVIHLRIILSGRLSPRSVRAL